MTMNLVEWAQYICVAIGGALGLFCLFDGTRRAVGQDPRGGNGRLVAVGLIIVLMLAGYSYSQHWMYAEVAESYRPAEARELPADWGKKMTPAKREAASQHAARGVFINSGKLRQHFDLNGQRKLYAPGPDDLKQREAVLATAAKLDHRAADAFNDFILWLVLGLCALFFGLCFSFERAATPVGEAEPRVEPTMPLAPAPGPITAAASSPAAAPAPAAAAAAPPAKAPPPKPAAAAKPVGADTVPLPKPALSDTVPLPKPPSAVGSSVGSDTVPLPKPPPGFFTPPKKS